MKAAKSFTRVKRKQARSATSSRPVPKRRVAAKSKATKARLTKAGPASRSKAKTARPTAKKRVLSNPKRAPRKVIRRKKPALRLPPILLEGDHPEMPQISGPGIKFALGPTAPPNHFDDETAELPASYGTKRLFLTPRDPHWIHAHWDLTRTQQARYNKLSTDHHMVLRVYQDAARGKPVSENHVHPESRHWFAHVEKGGVKYVAELGYYRQGANQPAWSRVAVSRPTTTPPARASTDTSYQQATIPAEIPLPKLAASTAVAVGGRRLPLARALEYVRTSGRIQSPVLPAVEIPVWTQERQSVMAEITSAAQTTLSPPSSESITELIRGQILAAAVAISGGPSSLPSSQGGGMPAVTSPSSPFGGMLSGEKGFWFNINAELVIYGGTEPDAKVSVGGHPVKLRPDGTFSLRFSLPDGEYDLPVVAVSGNDSDGRAADLKFKRTTDNYGDVGAHPQDATLKPPLPENV